MVSHLNTDFYLVSAVWYALTYRVLRLQWARWLMSLLIDVFPYSLSLSQSQCRWPCSQCQENPPEKTKEQEKCWVCLESLKLSNNYRNGNIDRENSAHFIRKLFTCSEKKKTMLKSSSLSTNSCVQIQRNSILFDLQNYKDICNFRFAEAAANNLLSYQKNATRLCKMTRKCSGTYL